MSTTDYAAHQRRAWAEGVVPLTMSQFVRLVVQIYRMERYETKAK